MKEEVKQEVDPEPLKIESKVKKMAQKYGITEQTLRLIQKKQLENE